MPGHLDGPMGRMSEFLGPEMPFAYRLVFGNLWLFGGLLEWQLDKTPPTRALIRTTTAATMFEGSIKENVLPARPRAVINVRVHPSDRIEDVLRHVEATIVDPRVTIQPLSSVMSEPSPESQVDSSAFTLLCPPDPQYVAIGVGADERGWKKSTIGLCRSIHRLLSVPVCDRQ